jgi:hypothetical protein
VLIQNMHRPDLSGGHEVPDSPRVGVNGNGQRRKTTDLVTPDQGMLSTLNSTDRDVYVRTKAFTAAYLHACQPVFAVSHQESRPSTMFPNTSFAINYGGEMTIMNLADKTSSSRYHFLGLASEDVSGGASMSGTTKFV